MVDVPASPRADPPPVLALNVQHPEGEVVCRNIFRAKN